MFEWSKFREFSFKRYPSLNKKPEKFYETFFSPFHIYLSQKNLQAIQNFVSACHKLRSHAQYQEKILKDSDFKMHAHESVLMSYDFHLSPTGPKLIEINTNAGFFLGVELLYEYYSFTGELKNPFPLALTHLRESFFKEHESNLKKDLKGSYLVIMDRDLENQDLFCEFLMFLDFFKEAGVDATIADVKEVQFKEGRLYFKNRPIDFIYNRHTDFHLKNEESQHLKAALLENKAPFTLSPHPVEYRLLASKKRQTEWQDKKFWESLHLADSKLETDVKSCLIPSFPASSLSPEELWKDRKKYFFKPAESFGSKAAYSGRGITRKVFDYILSHEYLVQEQVPPPLVTVHPPGASPLEFKYDLRVYVYRDQIQLMGARLFHGQTTNFKTPLGGFTPVLV